MLQEINGDVLFHIFSFSLRPAVLSHYSLVCKLWNELITSETFLPAHRKETTEQQQPSSPLDKNVFTWAEPISIIEPTLYDQVLELQRIVKLQETCPFVGYNQIVMEEKSNNQSYSLYFQKRTPSFLSIKAHVNQWDEIVSNQSRRVSDQLKEVTVEFGMHYEHCWYSSETNLGWLLVWKWKHFNHIDDCIFFPIIEHLAVGKTLLSHSSFEYGLTYTVIEYENLKEDDLYFDSTHNLWKKANSITNHEMVILENKIVDGNFELFDRLMRRGFTMELHKLKWFYYPNCDTNKFIEHYCLFHQINITEHVGSTNICFNTSLTFCKYLIDQCGVQVPKQLVNLYDREGNPNYEIIDYLKSIDPEFYCPLDTRSLTRLKNPKVIVLYKRKDYKKYLSKYSSYDFQNFDTEFKQKISQQMDKFLDLISCYDFIIHVGEYVREDLKMLQRSGKVILFVYLIHVEVLYDEEVEGIIYCPLDFNCGNERAANLLNSRISLSPLLKK